jgi:hypothetical protein
MSVMNKAGEMAAIESGEGSNIVGGVKMAAQWRGI